MHNPLSTKQTPILPFLKWPGGKRWLVSEHVDWFSSENGRHIEPFLGGGAAFFRSMPQSAILTDANTQLISTYEALRDEPTKVLSHLQHHHLSHNTAYYYSIRDRSFRSPASKAAQFIYLNRTCFNGIYRVNLRGGFNVPIGTKSCVLMPTDDFQAVSELLRRAKLRARDFAITIKLAREKDFLYIDPPYTVQHNNNNFVKYNEHIFSWADQIRLAQASLRAAKRGVKVLISNADHPSVCGLYLDKVWGQVKIHRHSVLASAAEKRRPTTELIVSNYLTSDGEIVEVRT